jgi:hypothetical protein
MTPMTEIVSPGAENLRYESITKSPFFDPSLARKDPEIIFDADPVLLSHHIGGAGADLNWEIGLRIKLGEK